MHPQRGLRPLGIALSLVVWGCGAPTTPAPSAATTSGSSATPEPAAGAGSATAPSGPQSAERHCPNPHGGDCLGELSAGTHTTRTFELPITYTVPASWHNAEDLPGNFLLVPPAGDASSVDEGADDYIGVYLRTVATNRGCATAEEAGSPEPGVGSLPPDVATELRSRPGVSVTEPSPVTIGGLNGLVMDVSLDPSWTGTCFYWQSSPVVPLIMGVPPSDFDHSLIGGIVLRLFLLEHDGGTIAIEVQARDVERLATYEDVVRSIAFGPEALQPSPDPSVLPPGPITAETLGIPLGAGARKVAPPFRVPFSLTLPDGWLASGLSNSHVTFEATGSGASRGFLGVYIVDGVFPDPCHRDMRVSAPTSVDGLAEAFAELVGFRATEKSAPEIDARRTRSMKLSNDIDTESSGCERGPMLPLFTHESSPLGEATNGGTTLLMWIVDAGDVPLLIVADGYLDATGEAVLHAIAASVDL